MKAILVGVLFVLMAGITTWADGAKEDPRTHVAVANYSAKEAAQGKTREELDAMIDEFAEELDEKRSELQMMEETMRTLKEIRDGAKSGEPVRLELGHPPQIDQDPERLFRNVGVGRTVQTVSDSERLKVVEGKVDRILEMLERKDP